MNVPTLDPIRVEDLLKRPSQRMPVSVCADVSGSMEGRPITDLNRALGAFFTAMSGDAVTRASVELALVAFASQAEMILDFQSLKRVTRPPVLRVDGRLGYTTRIGLGVTLALDLVQRRKLEYQVVGVDFFQPLLVILSDAFSTDEGHVDVAQRVRQLEAERRLVVLPVAIGPRVNRELLALFSAHNPPLHLVDQAFDGFFEWLGSMVRELSRSRPGDGVRYKRPDRQGWVDLA